MAKSPKRELLIETAARLFSEKGFHATGIDTILAEAKVAKKTLYNHFRSKDELILAVLRHHDSLFRNDFMRQVESHADTPKEQLLAIFDVAEKWFGQNDFFGCMYINAIGEFSHQDTPIREICKEYKHLMFTYIRDLCEKSGIHNHNNLAEEIALLFEGATVTAQVSQKPGSAQVAKKAAAILIEHALNNAATT